MHQSAFIVNIDGVSYSKERPSFERTFSVCAVGVMLNNFDVCNDDASKLDRFLFGELFCLKLKLDPSNRNECDVCPSMFDMFKSDEKMSFSTRALGIE